MWVNREDRTLLRLSKYCSPSELLTLDLFGTSSSLFSLYTMVVKTGLSYFHRLVRVSVGNLLLNMNT